MKKKETELIADEKEKILDWSSEEEGAGWVRVNKKVCGSVNERLSFHAEHHNASARQTNSATRPASRDANATIRRTLIVCVCVRVCTCVCA